jgi:hypothetical protein
MERKTVYFITEMATVYRRITYIMATAQKISATTHHYEMLEELLENYNKLLPTKNGRKSDDEVPKAWMCE